jgi:superfamily II DNA/RNA helicase
VDAVTLTLAHVLCVTLQIEEEAVKMAQYTEFRFVCVVGGERRAQQCWIGKCLTRQRAFLRCT